MKDLLSAFFHNPLRLDHMISIRLGSPQLDYKNGRVWNATVTLRSIGKSMHSAFTSVFFMNIINVNLKKHIEHRVKCVCL